MAYRSGMRECGAVEEEEKKKQRKTTTTATRTPLSSFRKWPVALVYYTKNTPPSRSLRRQKCLAGLRSTRDGNLGEPGGPPKGGWSTCWPGPTHWWRKQNLAASKQASKQVALFCRRRYCTARHVEYIEPQNGSIHTGRLARRSPSFRLLQVRGEAVPLFRRRSDYQQGLGPAFFCFFLFSFGVLLGG